MLAPKTSPTSLSPKSALAPHVYRRLAVKVPLSRDQPRRHTQQLVLLPPAHGRALLRRGPKGTSRAVPAETSDSDSFPLPYIGIPPHVAAASSALRAGTVPLGPRAPAAPHHGAHGHAPAWYPCPGLPSSFRYHPTASSSSSKAKQPATAVFRIPNSTGTSLHTTEPMPLTLALLTHTLYTAAKTIPAVCGAVRSAAARLTRRAEGVIDLLSRLGGNEVGGGGGGVSTSMHARGSGNKFGDEGDEDIRWEPAARVKPGGGCDVRAACLVVAVAFSVDMTPVPFKI